MRSCRCADGCGEECTRRPRPIVGVAQSSKSQAPTISLIASKHACLGHRLRWLGPLFYGFERLNDSFVNVCTPAYPPMELPVGSPSPFSVCTEHV